MEDLLTRDFTAQPPATFVLDQDRLNGIARTGAWNV